MSAAARSLSSLTNLRTLVVHTCLGWRSIAAYEGVVSIAHTLSKLPKFAHLNIDIHSLAMEEKQRVKEILQSSASLKKDETYYGAYDEEIGSELKLAYFNWS